MAARVGFCFKGGGELGRRPGPQSFRFPVPDAQGAYLQAPVCLEDTGLLGPHCTPQGDKWVLSPCPSLGVGVWKNEMAPPPHYTFLERWMQKALEAVHVPIICRLNPTPLS